jgi:hypothetical protein
MDSSCRFQKARLMSRVLRVYIHYIPRFHGQRALILRFMNVWPSLMHCAVARRANVRSQASS